ncbi:cyclic pyranopterin monophosphate synthase MoaC [Ruficoccus amylovorans]|uniref:Cyclic pyranopterin monophosphate synthase MoaC n=1 Tax=Ruficoccus amylovorans TaxID=1804625 RepID=A0A842HGP3_9BACT|nr:cyclic pyranopterin monophosphate synthase MoaC [Ruficoccus amylovorans]MBC2595479.1 cyclic pyranopterin monophosphate synthase MoaC [Ruficoccus amylovorans]
MEIANTTLTHLDEHAQPGLVDVSAKQPTVRQAEAEAFVRFEPDAWTTLAQAGFATSKGPISEVARVAGTMAVKQTAQWIPFCHPLPIDGCEFDLTPEADGMRIRCRVSTTARTGVEMEALTGASTAALTLYDMTKSLGHGTEILHIRLLSKSGGKSDFTA